MRVMNTCIILNPCAGSAKQAAALRQALAGQAHVTLRETSRPGQARELAAVALQQGAELVVAAGRDGTINEVVNGLATDFTRARLGLIPLGTGNDLARTLAIPANPCEALQVLTTGPERHLDVIQVESAGQVLYGMNMAIGGFTGQMNEVLTEELKTTWGPLAYLIGTVQVLPDLTDYEISLAWDTNSVEYVRALNIAVANGRTAAAGLPVSPRANPEDGLLDLVIVRYGSLGELAGVAAQFLGGTYLDSDHVMHRQVRRVHIAARPGMWFNIDGELLTKEPITFTVKPCALRVVVGPDYRPNPQQKPVATA